MTGAEEIQKIMADFRSSPPQSINGKVLVELIDYQSSQSKNLQNGTVTKIDLPKSNVLQFITEDGTKVSTTIWNRTKDQVLY